MTHGDDMAQDILKVHKVVSAPPDSFEANEMYAVRVGNGFDLYLADATGMVLHKLNSTGSEQGEVLKVPFDAICLGEATKEVKDIRHAVSKRIRGGNTSHSIFLKTPIRNAQYRMTTVHVSGMHYGVGKYIDFVVCFYAYNINRIVKPAVVSKGTLNPDNVYLGYSDDGYLTLIFGREWAKNHVCLKADVTMSYGKYAVDELNRLKNSENWSLDLNTDITTAPNTGSWESYRSIVNAPMTKIINTDGKEGLALPWIQVGDSAPKIATKKITGTYSIFPKYTKSFSHGLESSKILSVSVLVEKDNKYIPSYGYYRYEISSTAIVIKGIEDSDFLSKPVKIFITYEV